MIEDWLHTEQYMEVLIRNQISLIIYTWLYSIYQSWFSIGKFAKGSDSVLKLNKSGNGIYLFVISGSVKIGDEILNERDGLGIENIKESVNILVEEDCKLLAMEVPMAI